MHHILAHALPIVAAAYGRKFGVQVQVGGTRASTDGKTIRIPDIDETPVAQTLAWGYLTHEAAHVRHTDFAAFDATARQGALVQYLTNVLEDVRVDAAMLRTYPGTATTLWAVEAFLIREGHTRPALETDRPVQVMAGFVYTHCRRRVLHWDGLDALAGENERALRTTFPPTFVHRLLGLLTEVPRLDSTGAVAALAQRIVALIGNAARELPPAPKSHRDRDEGENRQGEDRDQPVSADDTQPRASDAPSGADAGGRTGGTQGRRSEGEEDARDEDGAGPAAGQSPESGDDRDDDAAGGDGRKALLAVLAAGEDELPGDAFQAVAEALARQATGTSTVLLPTVEEYEGPAAHGKAALARVRSESAKLAARLQGLVEAHTTTRTRTVRRGRILSATRLYRAAVGEDRIFARRDRRPAPNTALHLLVDLSGSMQGYRDRIALDAAMALALALEPMRGVSCAVTAFPGRQGSPERVTRILSHGDRVQGRAGAFVQGGRGGTPMTGALWFAAADLLARREERKIVLTLTDGEPDDRASAKDMVDQGRAAGVQTIGVGIATSVAGLFPVAIRIETVAELKAQLFGIAERLLLG